MHRKAAAQPVTQRRFVFFRTVTNESGMCGRCVIDTVDIHCARSAERAAAAAQLRFRRKYGLWSWDHLAHGYEVEES